MFSLSDSAMRSEGHRAMISMKRRRTSLPRQITRKGDVMKNALYNWLHDLAVALGLIPPPLQPVPIPSDEEQRKRQPRK